MRRGPIGKCAEYVVVAEEVNLKWFCPIFLHEFAPHARFDGLTKLQPTCACIPCIMFIARADAPFRHKYSTLIVITNERCSYTHKTNTFVSSEDITGKFSHTTNSSTYLNRCRSLSSGGRNPSGCL